MIDFIKYIFAVLTQIKEEDESKTSSRNSVDKDYLERMAAFNAAEKEEKEQVKKCDRFFFNSVWSFLEFLQDLKQDLAFEFGVG